MALPFIIAIAVVLGLSLFLFNEVRRPPGPREWGRTPRWKKRVRVGLASIPLIIALLLFWGFFIEPDRLVTREQVIEINNWPAGLSGLRIAVMGDIHAGSAFIDERKLHLIVDRTNALHPDLIVLLGDFVTGNRDGGMRVLPETTVAVLKDFRAPLGVYAVLGNHDWWYDGAKVRKALEDEGFHVLDDEIAEVKWRNGSFWLIGLADLWTRPQRVAETVAKLPAGVTSIALAHNPDIFPNLPQRVSMLLAAHTHGGQVNLPFIGTPVVPSDYGAKYTRGHLFENGHHLFVTSGIGTSIVPVRFRVPPEIVLVTINSASTAQASVR